MKVLLKGHNIKHDLRELIRIIFEYEEIEYIEDIQEYQDRGILLYNQLLKKADQEYMIVQIYENGKLIGESKKSVEDVEVYIKSRRKKRNIAIKKAIIEATNSYSLLPWGILTGIRPMKIVHDLTKKSIDKKLIRNVLREEYLIFDEKIDLLLRVEEIQKVYIKENKNKYSLYISIPFCPTRCLYCSFPSLNIDKYEQYIDKYIDTLIYEMDSVKDMMKSHEINTVYIGGGTPTSIAKEDLERIIQYINKSFGRENIKEFTVEAGRPDTIDLDYLKMLKKNNIDRISINPQTMNDETLDIIGREHNSKEIIDVYKMAKELEFKSINMDIIIGLPNEGVEEIEYTLKELEKLNPENLTIHTLAVKTNSKFNKEIDKYKLQIEDNIEEISNSIKEFISQNEYYPYYLYRQKQSVSNLENIGYSKKDKECIYNISMMEEKETIISVGMGGVSKIYKGNGRIDRVPNFKSMHDYLYRVDELIKRKERAVKL